jgi:PAS domain S-box-containing protein
MNENAGFSEIQKELAYKGGFQNNSEPIFIIDRQWNIVHANSAFAERFGKKLEEAIGINVSWLLSPDVRDVRIKHAEYAFRTGSRRIFEDYSKGRYFRHSVYPVAGNDANVNFLYIIVQDITETKLDELKIKRVAAISQEAIEAFPGPFTVIDVKGKIVSCNSHFHNIIAKEANEDLSGINTFDLFHSDDHSLLFEKLQNIIQNGVQETADLRVRLNGGAEYGWFRITTKRIIIDNEIFLVSSGTDIEKYKNTEKQLSFSNEQMHFILNVTNAGTWETSLETSESKWSDEIWPLFGLEAGSCSPSLKNWLNSILPEDRPSVEHAIAESIQTSSEFNSNWRVRDTDGNVRWLLCKGIPVKNADGKVTKFVGMILDITEKKRIEDEKTQLETRIKRSERLETLGNLAGGIAHDFNNMLTPILGYAEMGMIELPENHNVYTYLHEITKAAERAKNLVYQILTFSKSRETESSSISVQGIIDDALTLLRASIPSTISIKKHINQSCRNIFADPSKIYQVILNLCTNAFQAMEETGGTLTIELDEVIPGDALVRKYPELREEPYMLLSITDTGHGMESKTLDRIFEPFFTTKPVNKGTGLGLSVVHGIIGSYNGVIDVESQPGKDTTFHIYLPISDKTIASYEQHTVIPNITASILLVDDEEQVLSVMKLMLSQLGHRIEAMESPAKALELIKQAPEQFDLLITDLTMPEMTGIKLASEIYSYRRNMPVILMTGYANEMDLNNMEKNNIIRLLKKPIRFDVMIAAINEVLASNL